MLVTETSSWRDVLLNFVVSGALHQGTALKDHYDNATCGNLSVIAWDDSMRFYPNSLPMFTCALHVDSAAPRCPGSYPRPYGVPEAHSQNLVVLPHYSCDAIAPILVVGCMLNSGVNEHYASLDSCTMDAMVVCLVLRSFVFALLLVIFAILVLPPAHSTAQCRDAGIACFFLRSCHDSKPPKAHSSRRPSCAGTDFASSFVFGGIGSFGDLGRVVQTCRLKTS